MSIYHVSARKWFDKVNGNTYHSVAVTFPDGHVETKGMTYGYGNQYEWTAYAMIAPEASQRRNANGSYELSPWHWAEQNGHTIVYDVVEVTRKRDLHQA